MAEKKRPPTSGTRKGNGSGWGGSSRGNGSGQGRHAFTSPGPGRGHYSVEGEARAARQERHGEEMREILYGIAHGAQETNLRIQAADKLLNRIEGLPVAKIVTAETDPYSSMSDEEITAERERLSAMLATYERLKQEDEINGWR